MNCGMNRAPNQEKVLKGSRSRRMNGKITPMLAQRTTNAIRKSHFWAVFFGGFKTSISGNSERQEFISLQGLFQTLLHDLRGVYDFPFRSQHSSAKHRLSTWRKLTWNFTRLPRSTKWSLACVGRYFLLALKEIHGTFPTLQRSMKACKYYARRGTPKNIE